MSIKEILISDEEMQYLTVAEVIKELKTALKCYQTIAKEEIEKKGVNTSFTEGAISALTNTLSFIVTDARFNKKTAES